MVLCFRLPRTLFFAGVALAAVAAAAVVVLAVAGCDSGEPDEPVTQKRGTLVSSTRMNALTVGGLNQKLGDLARGVLPPSLVGDDPAALIDLLASQVDRHAYDVVLHRLIYRTVDTEGRSVLASGVIAMPQQADTLEGKRPFVIYEHGTKVEREEVASVIGYDDLETLAINLLFARDGYVAAMPDYLGSGAATLSKYVKRPTRPFHPYILAKPYVSASVDFMRAARAFAQKQGVAMNDSLFVTGYSEGGYAAMALTRALQNQYTEGEFDVTASAPMAGPYDLSGTMRRQLLSFEEVPAPYYLPYVLYSYNRVYDIYDDLGDALKPQYQGIGALFDGTHGGGEIDNQITNPPRKILKDEVIENFQNSFDHPLREALRQNNLWDWAPQDSMQMGHNQFDRQVPYNNSRVALEEFEARGAGDKVALVDAAETELGPLFSEPTHMEAFVPLGFATKRFFNRQRGITTEPTPPLSRSELRRRTMQLGQALPLKRR